jgi:5'-3' exonuclease
VFKEVDGKEFKDKVKMLNKFDDSEFGKEATNLFNELKEIPNELVGKKVAFLSKDLATVKTDLIEFKDKNLNELKFHFDKEKTKEKFEELEFKSLLDKL